MEWYNYFFAALAVVLSLAVLFVGMPNNAKVHNTAGVLFGLILLLVYGGIFYWNVFAA